MGILGAWLVAMAVQEAELPLSVTISTKDGNTVTGTCSVSVVKLESSLGISEIKLENIGGIIYEQAATIVRMNDGSLLRGKLSVEAWPIKSTVGDFTIKSENISSILVNGRRAAPVPAGKAAVAPPVGGKGKALASPPQPEPAAVKVAPLKQMELAAEIGELLLAADGRTLYALDKGEGKVRIVTAETLAPAGEIALKRGAAVMAMMPDGKSLVAAGGRTIWVMDPAASKVSSTFEIEHDIQRLAPEDAKSVRIIAREGTMVVSLLKKAVVQKSNPSSDGSGLSADATISPDVRFAVGRDGRAFRLGRSFVAAVVPLERVEEHTAAVFLPKSGRLLLFTRAGFVKHYDTRAWELLKSDSFGVSVVQGVADEGGKKLYVAGTPAGGGTGALLQYALPE